MHLIQSYRMFEKSFQWQTTIKYVLFYKRVYDPQNKFSN